MNKIKKVASFMVFSNDFKSKLTTAYPFLTADQIQLKLRKKWHDLSPNERKYYHKAVLCPAVNNASTKRQNSKLKKEKKISSKIQKDKQFHLKELTIFDDDLQLISKGEYEEGGFDDIFNKDKDDQFHVNIAESSKTYLKSRYTVKHPVPMVIDETPFGQQGILKKCSSEREKKMKVQFDFSAEHNNINEYKKKLGKNCNLPTSLHKETKEVNIKLKPREDTKGLKDYKISSKPKNSKRKSSSSKNNKPENKDQNPRNHLGSLKSNETVSYKTFTNNEGKSNENLESSENVEPLTPELQRNMSPRIMKRMCQAPKKKAIRGNFTSMDKMDCSGKKSETSLSIGNLDKMVLRRKPSFQKENLIEENFEFDLPSNVQFKDEESTTISMGNFAKRNKSLSCMNVIKSNQWPNMQDFYDDPQSLSSDDGLDLNNTNENFDTSIGWELSDEVSTSPIKHSAPLKDTLQLMEKSVSSLFTSVVSSISDDFVSDCSSLSGFSELSDQEMVVNDVSENEESDEKLSCEMQCATIDDITAGGDLQNEVLKINEESENKNENVLCDMFDDRHSMLIRLLPPPGNNGERIATELFEEDSIFG